ncbi:MAG: 2-dehydro-3-deoxyphosphogluconate aldolase [Cyanobium sp. CACIAM 14]|nr:MAG: 2-dehydro-3-deoxyphosphogluconate aldolase [Cyanobium sp. CACIAM 14]
MRHQPLLVVLRSSEPSRLFPQLGQLQDLGVRHVEIAWAPGRHWSEQCRRLVDAFPALQLGAASICAPAALEAVLAAGFSYGVSPILDGALLERAAAAAFPLVPGVMTPSEVNTARSLGCSVVKLFPAITLGIGYWRRLADPLGGALPFCIAAGGLRPQDVIPWLAAGVDAVALGSSLLAGAGDGEAASVEQGPLRQLLADLSLRL